MAAVSLDRSQEFSSFSPRTVVQTIVQIAIAIILSLSSALLLADFLTISFQAALLTTALAAAVFFFCSKFFPSSLPQDFSLPPLLRCHPPLRYSIDLKNQPLPITAPRGIEDAEDCCMSCILQMLNTSNTFLELLNSDADLPEKLVSFRTFFKAYEKAREERQPTIAPSLQPSQLTTASQDAGEILAAILNQWPKEMRVVLQEEEIPPFFSLEIPESPQLKQMLKHHFGERQFAQAPPSLFLQLKRFAPSQHFWQKIPGISSLLKPSTPKVETEVIIPNQIKIPLENNSYRRYQLTCVVQHVGESLEKGYYETYLRDREGHGYLCKGETVTQRDPTLWPLSKAYLLHYARIQKKDRPS